jgi:alpha-ketoglutarate-dependent taurine dioxygenase
MERLKKFSRLGEIKRKSVEVAPSDFVRTGYLQEEGGLPLVISPAVADVDLPEWAGSNREFLEAQLLKHGALLFRGFRINSPSEFAAVATAVCGELFGEYNDLPREDPGVKIYGSTPYPDDQTILFHNESSHLHRWPMRQWFFCVTAARQGGETPLVDCRKVYRSLDPTLVSKFEEKKLLYVRNFIEGLDVSWQDFFKTTDRAAVEAYCREAELEFEWKGDSGLKVSRVCPAVMRHPKTGEKTFFNQVQLHHVSTLAPAVRQSMNSLFRDEDLPRNVYYGDGTLIEDSVMDEITELYWKLAVSFPWRACDIILLDNMLTAHARNPYIGPRKIVVAMGEMINCSAIAR